MKKQFIAAIVIYLFLSINGYAQKDEKTLSELLGLVAQELSNEHQVKHTLRSEKRDCDLVLLNVDNNYNALKNQPSAGTNICVLSSEEIFLDNLANYIELVNYHIKSKTGEIGLFFVETSNFLSPIKKTKLKFRFTKKQDHWVVKR